MRPRFSIALLTEDRSEGTWRGLRAVVQKLLRRFEDDGYTPRLEIVPSAPSVRPILIANRWRSTKAPDQAEKRELWKYIARKLSEEGGVVLFHYDGDTSWSGRAKSQGPSQFESEIRLRVEQVLRGPKVPPAEVQRRLSKLIACVPYYSIEAWLLQATERAITLCRERHAGADIEKFEEWGADRTKLDDVHQPKNATCLKDAHNEDLGRHVPVWDVVRAGRSLAGFVQAMRESSELKDALAEPSE